MLSIRLDSEIEERLERLAKKTGRTKTYYAREAILEHLQDLEDIYLATSRLETKARTYSAEAVKRELGLKIRRPRGQRSEEAGSGGSAKNACVTG
jgi:RHH-type rel operon transcriptional repressor/antitoxin RelB